MTEFNSSAMSDEVNDHKGKNHSPPVDYSTRFATFAGRGGGVQIKRSIKTQTLRAARPRLTESKPTVKHTHRLGTRCSDQSDAAARYSTKWKHWAAAL